MSEQRQQLQEQEQSGSASSSRPRRHVPPMPSDDVLRNSIARSLTQILVNMTNAEGQQKCRELLQVENLAHGAHIKILSHLEYIDARREHKESATQERKQRRVDKENRNNTT